MSASGCCQKVANHLRGTLRAHVSDAGQGLRPAPDPIGYANFVLSTTAVAASCARSAVPAEIVRTRIFLSPEAM